MTDKVFVEKYITTYALTRKLRRTSLKTMWPLAEVQCQLISYLRKPIMGYGSWQ
jgi:hypothetical protein